MGDKKIIEMPKMYLTEDSKSLSVLSTFMKIEKYDQANYSYLSELSTLDIENIEKAYSAACIYSAIGMLNEKHKAAAQVEIESLIGDYAFSIDMYRLFVRVYGDLLKYNSLNIEDNIQDFVQSEQCSYKLA